MKLLMLFALIGITVAQFPNYSTYRPFGSTTQAPRYQPFGSTTQAPRYQPFGSTTQAPRYQPFGSTIAPPRFQSFNSFPSTTQASRVSDGKYRAAGGQYQSGPSSSGQYQANNAGRYNAGSAAPNPFQYQGSNAGNRFVPIPSSTFRPTINTYAAQPFVGPTGAPYARRFSYNNEGQWRVFRDDKHVDQDGYAYEYETENKIVAAEQGRIHNRGTDAEALKTSGFYEYIGDDGVKYRVDYIADENGFQPVGAHIPTVPPAIQRALDYVAARNRQGLH